MMAIYTMNKTEVEAVSGGFLGVNLGINDVRILGDLFDNIRSLLKGLAGSLGSALSGVPVLGNLLTLLGSESSVGA